MRIFFALTVTLLTLNAAAGQVEKIKDPDSGLFNWRAQENGFSLELIQLVPDYLRAIYSSRGLPKAIGEGVAAYCAFGSIAKNTADKPVSYKVAEWYAVSQEGKKVPLKTKSEWIADWKKLGVPFAYSILPDEQTFEVGDWGQGFTTVKLPHNSIFDLHYFWSIGDEKHSAVIKNLQCAPE